MPKESFRDIVSLAETITNPDTPVEEQCEVFETIREMLFPEVVGDIRIGHVGSVEQTPDGLQRRVDHVGSRIKKKRKEKKLTQVELAKRSGLPQSHICRLEAGVHSPSMKTLEKIARALGVAVGDLDPSNGQDISNTSGRYAQIGTEIGKMSAEFLPCARCAAVVT